MRAWLALLVIVVGLNGAAVAAGVGVPVPGLEGDGGSEPAGSGELDTAEVERLIFQELNEKRAIRYDRLARNDRIADRARGHASDMAANEYFSHTSLNGTTQQERYAFCDGGENIAQTFYERPIQIANGETMTLTTEVEVANAVVRQWMGSKPHREDGIYGQYWASGGAGVAVGEDQKVYAVFAFCAS